MDRKLWFKLPLAIRQRWWKETNYGQNQPSIGLEELMFAHGMVFEESTMERDGDAEGTKTV